MILRMAVKSLWSRRFTASVIAVAIGLSVALLITVEKVRHGARNAFIHTISGTDLIVGPRTGSVQLLLYTVFHIGFPSHSLSWNGYQAVANHPSVAWAVPIAMGDSHKGFPVVATNRDFFQRYHYGKKYGLKLSAGHPFSEDNYNTMVGSEVAASLGYQLGAKIILAHGEGKLHEDEHADHPFIITGILEPTGTPVDRTVYITLEGMELMHANRMGGIATRGIRIIRPYDEHDHRFNAVLVGLKARNEVLQARNYFNTFEDEPLLAIMPRVTLEEIWTLLRVVERTLVGISSMVVMVGLAGMVAVLLTGLNERRRELAILRSLGAGPRTLCLLLLFESGVLTLAGSLLGLFLVHVLLPIGEPWILRHYGLNLGLSRVSLNELWITFWVVQAGIAAGLLPAYRAYRYSLADGLTIRL